MEGELLLYEWGFIGELDISYFFEKYSGLVVVVSFFLCLITTYTGLSAAAYLYSYLESVMYSGHFEEYFSHWSCYIASKCYPYCYFYINIIYLNISESSIIQFMNWSEVEFLIEINFIKTVINHFIKFIS